MESHQVQLKICDIAEELLMSRGISEGITKDHIILLFWTDEALWNRPIYVSIQTTTDKCEFG